MEVVIMSTDVLRVSPSRGKDKLAPLARKQQLVHRGSTKCLQVEYDSGPRNMLGVFITLLYTYTMPINYYSSKPTSLRCHLLAKHCLKASRNQNLRHEISQHVAVKV